MARLLLIGKDYNTMDMFFEKLNADFSCVTCSWRTQDLKWHVDTFKPDAIVYCMFDEDEKNFNSLASFRRNTLGSDKHFILIGSDNEVRAFQRMTANAADGEIADPESIGKLKEDLVDILSNAVKSKADSQEKSGSSWADILNQMDNGSVEARKHILVVDDDPLMLKVIKDYLHDDYEVATAKSGSIAIKFLEKKKTDLILLDYEMPEEKGPDVLKKLRELPGVQQTPVVFLTGVKDKERLVEIVKVKPQGYLCKPVERAALFEMIKKVMG